MALVLINGFDDQIHGASAMGTWSGAFDTINQRNGSAAFTSVLSNLTSATNAGLLLLPGGGDATVIVGSAMQFLALVGGATPNRLGWQFFSDNGSVIHVTVQFTPSTGVISVFRGGTGGTALGTATIASGPALLASTWTYWEVKVVLSDTVGEVHVRLNGIAVLDLTGLDTKNAGTKTVIDAIGYPCGTSQTTTWVDDLYVVTGTGSPNDFLGDSVVATVYPSGNGDYSQLVGSDGNSVDNYALVNEAGAAVTSSYVESATVGQRDFYQMADPSPGGVILGVQVTALAENPDAGAGRSVAVGVRQGSSEAMTSNQALTGGSYVPARGVFVVDPATGVAWTQSGVNSAQAGLQVG
jgi:hypothetical protein